MTQNITPRVLTYVNSAEGGTPSWNALMRLQADVLDYSPDVVYIDFAVNDAGEDPEGGRTDGFAPAAEALVRRIRAALPNAQIVVISFVWPANYSFLTASLIASRDKWSTLATTYGLIYLDWGATIADLLGIGYGDSDVEQYLSTPNNVHPNTAGHLAAFDMIAATITSAYPAGQVTPLPDRVYAEAADYEYTPIIRTGTDNDGETGTGWSTSGTARLSSTANDTIAWSGTFCSFGLDTPVGAGAGVIEYDIDGGGWTSYDLTAEGVTNNPIWNMARGAHTVTIRVVSGTVQINRFLAI